MGNRAVITTRHNFDNNGVGVYLHWNGGNVTGVPYVEKYGDDYASNINNYPLEDSYRIGGE